MQADGAEIVTVEGLRATDGTRHPMQQAFLENFGLQCGYCTPGMLITAIELLRENPHPSEQDVREALSGNICRCTGYQAIVDSVLAVARDAQASKKREIGVMADARFVNQRAVGSPVLPDERSRWSKATAASSTISACRACTTWLFCAASMPMRVSALSIRRKRALCPA